MLRCVKTFSTSLEDVKICHVRATFAFSFSEGTFVQGGFVHDPEQGGRGSGWTVSDPEGGALLVREAGLRIQQRNARETHGTCNGRKGKKIKHIFLLQI